MASFYPAGYPYGRAYGRGGGSRLVPEWSKNDKAAFA